MQVGIESVGLPLDREARDDQFGVHDKTQLLANPVPNPRNGRRGANEVRDLVGDARIGDRRWMLVDRQVETATRPHVIGVAGHDRGREHCVARGR